MRKQYSDSYNTILLNTYADYGRRYIKISIELSLYRSWIAIVPEIVLTITAILILLAGAFRFKLFSNGFVSSAGIFISGGLNLFFWNMNIYAFNRMIVIDNISILMNSLILMSAFLVNMISAGYTNSEEKVKSEYYSLILFSVIGMNLISKTFNLIIIFVSLEIFSLALYILVGLGKEKALSLEASLKYFLVGAFTTSIFLYGIALIYGTTGLLNLNELNWSNIFLSTIGIVGFVFIITGFLFKIGIVPFHMWLPDTYQGSGTPITAFMSVAVKIAIFVPLIRIFINLAGSNGFLNMSYLFTGIFVLLAIITQTLGNIIAIQQTNIKRMLAYSSIAHAGYMMLAFLPAKDFQPKSIIFYLTTYLFMNIGAFAVVSILESKNKLEISDYRGLSDKYPLLALSMVIFLLSLTGIPTTAGFVAKLYIFSYAIKSGYIIPVLIAVVNSVISAYYYVRIIMLIYMSNTASVEIKFSPFILIPIVLSVIITLYLGIFPNQFLEFLN